MMILQLSDANSPQSATCWCILALFHLFRPTQGDCASMTVSLGRELRSTPKTPHSLPYPRIQNKQEGKVKPNAPVRPATVAESSPRHRGRVFTLPRKVEQGTKRRETQVGLKSVEADKALQKSVPNTHENAMRNAVDSRCYRSLHSLAEVGFCP